MDDAVAGLIARERRIAYALTDRNLTIVEVGGVTSVLGDLGRSAVGRSLSDLVPELVGVEALLADIVEGVLPRCEFSRLNRETPGGQIAYVDYVELPYVDSSGHIAGLLHVVQEVTETGRLEQEITQQRNELQLLQSELFQRNMELEAANVELKRLDELKSRFVSIAAHELRNPLAAILGYVEVLLDGDIGPLVGAQRDYLGIVFQAGHRLLDITNDLLDVTRIETGRMDLILRPTDLGSLVRRVVTEYSAEREEKGLGLDLEVDADLPDALCDETRSAQIIGNLVGNAQKYTDAGGEISVHVGAAGEDGFLQVSVSDTGMGIAQEDQSELFSLFYRTEEARLGGTRGTGLGLYVARSLVELHGGRIWLESEAGKGSTFYVTFVAADG
jgi:signal transduction histidine kinase